MSTDTAQPGMAAENVALDDAANAFKVHLGQIPAPVARDDSGRFASTAPKEPEAEEIAAEEAAPAGEAAQDDAEQIDAEQAPDEGQPEPVEMPTSWSKEDAEAWEALPPDLQAKVAEREGQRDAAVNQKFQEAANVKKANIATIEAATQSRQEAIALIDQVTSLIVPQAPSRSMLNPQSSDYNPDAYHYQRAEYEQAQETVHILAQQRQQMAAQQSEEQRAARQQAYAAIEEVARPALFEAVPDLKDPVKASGALNDIINYAVSAGIPAEVFKANADEITSAEMLIAWKAQQYDKLQKAKAKVAGNPAPQPKPQPSVRPGVATPRAATEQAKLKGAFDRLSTSGSIEDGAAVFKQLMKGR